MAIQAASQVQGTIAQGQYTIPVQATSAAVKLEMVTIIGVLETLITGQTATTQTSMASPDFQTINPALQRTLLAETATMKAAINAGA